MIKELRESKVITLCWIGNELADLNKEPKDQNNDNNNNDNNNNNNNNNNNRNNNGNNNIFFFKLHHLFS